MAGLGSRFTKIGINTPKPLIPIFGKPMAKWAGNSIPFANSEDFIFIVRKEHIQEYQLDQKMKDLFPGCRVIEIDYVTQGAACTVLLAKEFINNEESLIITDCDHFFVNNKYSQLVQNPPEDLKGIIPVLKVEGDKWSFTKFDENHVISEVAEKTRISEFGNLGAYYFRYGKDFVWAAEQMISRNLRFNNEFYVAPVYNMLLERGDKLMAAICDEAWCLGTPEDVEKFERNFNK